jgi:hypothetical protein
METGGGTTAEIIENSRYYYWALGFDDNYF